MGHGLKPSFQTITKCRGLVDNAKSDNAKSLQEVYNSFMHAQLSALCSHIKEKRDYLHGPASTVMASPFAF